MKSKRENNDVYNDDIKKLSIKQENNLSDKGDNIFSSHKDKENDYEFIQNQDGSFKINKKNKQSSKNKSFSLIDGESIDDVTNLSNDVDIEKIADFESNVNTDTKKNKNKSFKFIKSKSEKKLKKSKQKQEQERKEKEYQKGTFKKNMKSLAILLVLGIFTGSGLGVWYFNYALKSKVDYSLYEVNEYLPDINQRFSSLFGITNEEDKENWVDIAREQGYENPLDSRLTPIDNYLLAMYNAEQEEEFVIESNGLVKSMGTSQTVYSLKTFNGNLYTFESISTGFITIAFHDEMPLDKNGNPEYVEIYNGKKGTITATSAEWELDERLSISDYKEETGGLLSTLNPYIISEKTVLNLDTIEITVTEEGYYSMTFELHPIYSVLNYYRQVRRTGQLEADPYFSSLSQTIVIDKDWNMISTYVEENYNAVKMGFGAKCYGTLLQEFYFDGSYEN